MVNRDGASVRKERLSQLIELIQNHQDEDGWTRNRITGVFMLQTGLKPERINEYINQLIELGIIRQENERLFYDVLMRKISA